ncbi:hypothetical protein [Streptomyces coeruleorubidus]|uniref:hypothetical protein n=1 Tax=Streptomyces coeruleorubidus TaxID=116188 RepID=UPI0036876BC4
MVGMEEATHGSHEFLSMKDRVFRCGSFKAADPEEVHMVTQTADPARSGSNEHTLDQVRHYRYVPDLRTASGPARPGSPKSGPRAVPAPPVRETGTGSTSRWAAASTCCHQERVREADLLSTS